MPEGKLNNSISRLFESLLHIVAVIKHPRMSFEPLALVDPDDVGESQIPGTANFGQFQTIDWIEESQKHASSTSHDNPDLNFESSWHRYRYWAWKRFREIITLTCIAILLGFIAGSIQIVTETLVNWKSGHCARNWLLNKSFCCAGVQASKDIKHVLIKRDELQCIKDGMWVDRSNPFLDFSLFVVLSLIFASASALMVIYIAPMATGSGISEIKVWVSGFRYKDEFLGLATLLVKSIALPLAISSGLSVGKEGPSVHYATCCGFVITNLLLRHDLNFSEQSEFLIASTAGGVAVAFGAPIGGVLFGLEEMSSTSYFNLSVLWKSYYVALGAVATLQYMNPFRNGKIVLFEVTYDNQWSFQEIPIFVVLGIFGGLYGILISNWNVRYVNFRKTYLQSWKIQEVVILTLITALVSYFNEFLKLDMTESMGILFHECVGDDGESLWTHRICQLDSDTHAGLFVQILLALVFATVIRSLLIVVSYGCSVPAGIFVPSMAVGATFGRGISLMVERWITGQHKITPGTYAFLGAAATLSGITNLTLTVVVIMIELTGAFSYIIPSMIVVAVTHSVYGFISSKGGIADQMITVNGFPILENLQDEISYLDGYKVGDIMSQNIVSLPKTLSLSELTAFLERNEKFKQFPVVDEKSGSCIGYVKRTLLSAEAEAAAVNGPTYMPRVLLTRENEETSESDIQILPLDHIVNRSPIVVASNMPLQLLNRYFQKLGCKLVIVEASGCLQGLLTKKDFLKFERLKHRELHGPLYTFNSNIDQKLWSIIKTIFRISDY
ncbi:LANO_0G16534g1_1 [Lachancea nothofagi CBS 11611]|uniref:Chloride channel protein n=1 Tax=Lachancea nothofagi CBS 11611 TaxID=1266666 RepID=A0A1G4KKD2_9SACH|nr:LANO_0G16534g1_1 [Lachancea nothofagi CBS 11611]